ncbi:MAG: hypothetical protein ACFNUJ_06260 [Campylobacter curvus]
MRGNERVHLQVRAVSALQGQGKFKPAIRGASALADLAIKNAP